MIVALAVAVSTLGVPMGTFDIPSKKWDRCLHWCTAAEFWSDEIEGALNDQLDPASRLAFGHRPYSRIPTTGIVMILVESDYC